MTISKIEENSIKHNNTISFKAKKENDTIKGVLLNKYIQNRYKQDFDFDVVCDSLLVPNTVSQQKYEEKENSGFDFKKTIKPVVFAAVSAIAGFAGISYVLKKTSNMLAKKDLSGIVVPPDLPVNMNIVEEPHFALYRALRNPSAKNIVGFGGVCLFSGITLSAKTFVDGIKDVWVKKQECDIDYDFKKDMIQVDRDVFSGKLNVVNSMLKETSDYFKSIFSKGKKNTFKDFINFEGKETPQDNKENKNKNIKNFLIGSFVTAGIVAAGFFTFKNYQKTIKNLDKYVDNYDSESIKKRIAKLCDKKDIDALTNFLKTINVSQENEIGEYLSKAGANDEQIKKATKDILRSQIYAKTPDIFGGGDNKIQYYCYINEDRGHLYNWILNPENAFNKYIFLGFSAVSSVSYILNAAAEAIKSATVARENKKSELNLKKNLVAVEIENFKAKKESAINPLVESFKIQKQNGKSEEELKEMAQNILIEIKDGPPYVYS